MKKQESLKGSADWSWNDKRQNKNVSVISEDPRFDHVELGQISDIFKTTAKNCAGIKIFRVLTQNKTIK